MSGIAGWIDFTADISKRGAVLKEMTRALTPRGPDEAGMYIKPHVALLHRRLSVVDPEHGKQPMICRAGENEAVLVYNGELYNTPELRSGLIDAGYSMNGRSDTEVLLLSYLRWGRSFVERLSGIFAFAIYDGRDRSVFMARDPMGVKPLFYSLKGEGLIFGSEIKALLQNPLIKPRLGKTGVAEIMLLGPGRTPGCGVLEGISELRPGHCAVFEEGRFRARPYWRLRAAGHEESLDQTVERVRGLVTEAVESQLVSDAELGAFLSGGLDSGVIAAIAAGKAAGENRRLPTFSVEYRDNGEYPGAPEFQSDSGASCIGSITRALNVKHRAHVIGIPELAASLKDAALARDLPGMADLDGSLLLFCREVKRSCTVALSGEGAGAVFGGYPWYRGDAPLDGFPWMRSPAYRAGFIAPGAIGDIDPKEYVSRRFYDTIGEADTLPSDDETDLRMRRLFVLNLQWFTQSLLERLDRMSMACGLEVRVPFCDKRLVEYMYNVPWRWKSLEGREKGLLRKAMAGLLPDDALWHKKYPCSAPRDPFYMELVSGMLREVFNDRDAPLWKIVRRASIPELMTAPLSQPWYGQLMTAPQAVAWMVQLNAWLTEYKIELV